MTTAQLAQLILKTIRTEKTQDQVNEYFGFNFNQCYRWESGKTKVSWNDFVKLLTFLNVDLSPLKEKCLRVNESIHDGTELFNFLTKDFTSDFVQKKISLSNAQYMNLRSGRTSVLLEHILDIVKNLIFLQASFIAYLYHDREAPKEIENLLTEDLDIQNFTTSYPQALLLPALFSIKSYTDLEEHSDEVILETLKIKKEEVDFLLDKAVRFLFLEIENGKYIPTRSVQRLPFTKAQDSIHHFVFDYLNTQKNQDLKFFNPKDNIVKMTIANLTTSQKTAIEELSLSHWNKVKEILYSQDKKDIDNGDANHVFISTLTLHQITN